MALIHMRAINNRGPYNTGEDFYVEPQDVKRHTVYAVVVQATKVAPAEAPEPVVEPKVESTQADDTQGQQEKGTVAENDEGQPEVEAEKKQTPKKVTKPARTRTKKTKE
jgi:hypothetical protein